MERVTEELRKVGGKGEKGTVGLRKERSVEKKAVMEFQKKVR